MAKSKAKAKAKPEAESPFKGRWLITSTSLWEDSEDEEDPEFIEFAAGNRLGNFRLGGIQGDVDWREGRRDGGPAVEFSWEGDDESEQVSGRGWAVLEGDALRGWIGIHRGDESGFEARREGRAGAARGRGKAAKGASRAKSKAPSACYQLKITLKDAKPPIWRRILVPDCTLADLHDFIQQAMGWGNCHMWEFQINGDHFGDAEFMEELEMEDAGRAQLGRLLTREKLKFTYIYDFGDNWRHEILVEKILPPEPGREVPACLAGKRACPPDDVGGIWGYEDFVEAAKDPKHPEHAERMEWAGGEFDPEAFDVDAVNAALKAMGP